MTDKIKYTESFELILKQEGQKSESMAILHSFAYQKYNRLSMLTNIPVIILSALVGFLSPVDIMGPNQPVYLGALSVGIGIIKTLDSYMSWTQRAQNHYNISLNYKKIAKFIEIQLGLEKECRISPNDLLNVITNDIENIVNSEPCIPDDVVTMFTNKYGSDVSKTPSLINGKLTDIKINQPVVSSIEIQTEEAAAIFIEEQTITVRQNKKKPTFK